MMSDIKGGSEEEDNSPGPGRGSVVSGRKKAVVEYICHNQPLHEDGADSMAASHLPQNQGVRESKRPQGREGSATEGFVVGDEFE